MRETCARRLLHVGDEPGVERREGVPVAKQRRYERRVGRELRGELGVGVERAVAQKTFPVTVGGEAAWGSCVGLVADLVASAFEAGDGRRELPARP
jgi:hypothetical protein